MNKICLSILFLCLISCINAQRRPAPAVQYPRYLTSSAIFNSTCPRVRKSWNSLTTADKTLYVSAFNRLKQTGLWDQFTIMHNDDTNRQYAHGAPGFFVWHRYFLFQFEEALRALGPQYRCLTLPYWPFEMEAGNEGTGDVHKYFGGPNDYNSNSLCVTFGSLRNWRVTADQTCLRRTWDSSYSFIGEARIVDLITSYPSYGLTGGFRSQIEGAPHAGVHNYVGGGGGHMGTMNSNADPFFYLLHANIDRLFAIWEDCHDYDRISGDISGRSWPGSNSNAEMPYVYNGQTHPLFTRTNTKVAITPRSVYQLGTNVLPYLYDPNDRLVGLLESTAGDGVCKFHWFNTATNSVSPKPVTATATATATIAETAKRAVEAGNHKPRGRPSDYQRVHFWDNRVQKSYDSICVEEIPDAPKPYQIHATAIEECNICTSHGAKKHASDQWIVAQNMANEWIVFQPICSVNATNAAVVPELEVPVTQPIVTQPIATQPTYSQPDYSQPQYSQPDYSQSQYSQPSYSQPQYSQSSYSQPQYPQSGYSHSGYSQPHHSQQYSQPRHSQQYSQPDYSLSGYLQSAYAELDYSQLEYQPNYGKQQTYYATNIDGDKQGYNGNNDRYEDSHYDRRDDDHDDHDDDRRNDRHHDRQHDDDDDRRDDRHDDRRHDRHDNDDDDRRDDRHHDRRHDDDDRRDDRHHDRQHDDDDDRRDDRHDRHDDRRHDNDDDDRRDDRHHDRRHDDDDRHDNDDHDEKKHNRHHDRDERRHHRHEDDDDRRDDREHKGDRY